MKTSAESERAASWTLGNRSSDSGLNSSTQGNPLRLRETEKNILFDSIKTI